MIGLTHRERPTQNGFCGASVGSDQRDTSISDIKAGVVGIGFIGVAHVEALRRLGVDVVGVIGSTPDRARHKAEATGLPRVYEHVEDLAADPL